MLPHLASRGQMCYCYYDEKLSPGQAPGSRSHQQHDKVTGQGAPARVSSVVGIGLSAGTTNHVLSTIE
jgi:hypothetical protein